jgi:hypothetical protein
VSGIVRLLVTSPDTSDEPIGEPSPVTVLAPLDDELPLDVVVLVLDAMRAPEPLEGEWNVKPPKLHEPPNGPKTPG